MGPLQARPGRLPFPQPLEVLEASTPGQLDAQMIERVSGETEDVELPRFLRYFLAHRDIYAKCRLQQFLQENLLSSYLRVVARRPATD